MLRTLRRRNDRFVGAAMSEVALRLGRRSGMELGAVGEQVLFGARFKL